MPRTIPQITAVLSLGLLLNPFINWQQVTALFLVYLLLAAEGLYTFFDKKRVDLDEKRLKDLETEIKAINTADAIKRMR